MDVSKAALRAEAVARLDGLPGLRSKGMFGAYGLWAEDGVFFGIVDDRLYLRVDDATRPRYAARGATGFDWSGGREPPSEAFYGVPDDVWDDPPTLLAWAEDSVDVSRLAKGFGRRAARPARDHE